MEKKYLKNKIPTRSRQAIPDLINLEKYYTHSLDDDWLLENGNNLSSLPKGVQAYCKAAFDIRGLIQLRGKNLDEKKKDTAYPVSVKKIKVNLEATQIHFLHGASGTADEDTKIGEYVIHYEDGQTKSVPILYGKNIRNWWNKEKNTVLINADTAWTGENKASKAKRCKISLYKYTVNNPIPSLTIKSIDFISEDTESAPFLIGITVVPPKVRIQQYRWFDTIKIANEIIPREKKADPKCVDLSKYFNASLDDDWFNHPGHDLQDVPKGIQLMDGVQFDVRGLIQIAGARTLEVTGLALPEEIKGIKINQSGALIHFLHACAFCSKQNDKLGDYVLHYENGETRKAPIIYKKNILDWWLFEDQGHTTEAVEVWYGSNPSSRRVGIGTRLIKYTWRNPFPDIKIVSMDFVSAMELSAPFLVAMTFEG